MSRKRNAAALNGLAQDLNCSWSRAIGNQYRNTSFEVPLMRIIESGVEARLGSNLGCFLCCCSHGPGNKIALVSCRRHLKDTGPVPYISAKRLESLSYALVLGLEFLLLRSSNQQVANASTSSLANTLVDGIPATKSRFFSIQAVKPVDEPAESWDRFLCSSIHRQPGPSSFLVAAPNAADSDAETISGVAVCETGTGTASDSMWVTSTHDAPDLEFVIGFAAYIDLGTFDLTGSREAREHFIDFQGFPQHPRNP